MTLDNKVDVFLWYAEEDHEKAEKLCNDLKNAGITVWMYGDILPGQNREIMTRQAMRGSSFILSLLSSRSVSKKGVLQKELKTAMSIMDEFLPDEIFIIPVKIEPCDPVHERLRELESVELFRSYENGLNRILRALEIRRIESKKQPETKPDGKKMLTAFVLMPFDQLFDSYYHSIYVPALKSAGLKAERGDSLYASVPIMDDIRNGIMNADILLADLTGRNPNVFYELGLAHALNKPVILIAQSLNDLPFDLRHLRTITYSTSQVDWAKKLHDAIVSSAHDFMRREHPSDFRLPASRELIERRKVDIVRWHALSPAEQADLYERFKKLKGRYNLPTRPLAPSKAQVALQKDRPIDLSLIEILCQQFAPHMLSLTQYSKFPMKMQELLELRKIQDPIINGIEAAIDSGLSDNQYNVFRRLYDYLVVPEWQASSDEQANCDLVVVVGSRSDNT